MNIATPANHNFQFTGQGVNHRYTNAVQSATELVTLVGELAPGMQGTEYDLHPGLALFRVHIHRHTAAVI